MKWINVLLGSLICCSVNAQHTFTVAVNEPKATIQPTMWGVFFEDINFGADGGIYAELVKNRSFEFTKPLMGWSVKQRTFREGAVLIMNRGKENTNNPRFLRIKADHAQAGDLILSNEGFRGMGIKAGLRYDFSMMYRQETANLKLHVQLADSAGKVLGETVVVPTGTGSGWHKAQGSLTASETVMKAKMNIWFEGSGSIDLDMISLFPSDTWKQRPGGMRADMVQRLADLKPGFIRFPGGCIVEGTDLSNRYQWKKTIGPVEERPLMMNRWNIEFAHRLTPDYFQSFGLGFFEYFQLADDIGAEPLPILNCGMACQYNSAELASLKDLDPYVQDALDLIEFANGAVTTTWGKVRADMGHPAPFHLKMLGVGNENWGPQYVERLQVFKAAIKSKYPDIKIVASSGTDPDGERFSFLNDTLRAMQIDLIDEHYYRRPDWFLANAKRYDNYPRNAIKIFAGEYAAQSDRGASPNNKNNWLTALSEAAFMTGLERNADVVTMSSYAPLFAHTDGWQWAPDLIWVNNLQSFGTTDYYVQQMFSLNRGNRVVPVTIDGSVVAGKDSLYATAAIDSVNREVIIKVVNVSGRASQNKIVLNGVKKIGKTAKMIVLQNDDLNVVNSFSEPEKIAPKEVTVNMTQKQLPVLLAPYSFVVIRIKLDQ